LCVCCFSCRQKDNNAGDKLLCLFLRIPTKDLNNLKMKKNFPAFVLTEQLSAFILYSSSAQEQQKRIIENDGTASFKAVMMTEPSLTTHTVFRPEDLGAFKGENKLPIIAWGNGACYDSPWEHVNFLYEVASHGFLVVAIGSMPKESGEQVKARSASSKLIDALNWAIAQNNDRKSPYYGKIDTSKIAVSGMSCGGLQTLEVAADPRISTIVVCNSGLFSDTTGMKSGMPRLSKDHLKKIHTPTLYLLGGPSDIAYDNGMDDYRKINHV